MINYLKYFKTVIQHKYEVGKILCKFGLYRQALTHDLSKFTPTEIIGYTAGYYTKKFSDTSCLDGERLRKLNSAWLHHRGRNKHHPEYWLDIENKEIQPYRMPLKYVYEMVADYIGAGKVYNKDNWNDKEPFIYYKNKRNRLSLNEQTLQVLDFIFSDLNLYGLDAVAAGIQNRVYEKLYNDKMIVELELWNEIVKENFNEEEQ